MGPANHVASVSLLEVCNALPRFFFLFLEPPNSHYRLGANLLNSVVEYTYFKASSTEAND